MRLDFLNTMTMDEAREMIKDLAGRISGKTEIVPLRKSLGRVVSTPLFAEINLPSFRRSTVDGYAVKGQDVFGATTAIPSILDIKGEVLMGEETDLTLLDNEAIYVPTGGMVPEGAEAMVMIENTEKLDERTILIYKPSSPGDYVVAIGEDLAIGDEIIAKGRKISAYDIGLLAGMGIHEIEVYKVPSFTIISTGDEIIDIDQPMKFGQVRDINGYSISALIEEMGGCVIEHRIIQDDFEALREGIVKGLEQSESVVISGGSSVGVRDYTRDLIESFETGKLHLHGLSVKPGKPTIVGEIDGKVVFGLPGHPASALMICQQIIGSYLEERLQKQGKKIFVEAELLNNVHGSPGRDTYQMVRLILEDGRWKAKPIYGKSGMMNLLAHSSGYFRIDRDQEGIEKGERVKVYVLQEVRV